MRPQISFVDALICCKDIYEVKDWILYLFFEI